MAACPRTSSGDVGSSIRLEPRDRLVDAPPLVGVDRDADVPAHDLAGDPQPAHVVVEVRAHLELDLAEARCDGLPREARELLVAVAEPAGARRIRRVAARQQRRLPLAAARRAAAQQLERLLRRQCVADVSPVHDADELLGGHVHEELPDRLARPLRGEVPGRVDHRAGRHVHDALLGAEPAQLRVAGQLSVEAAEVQTEVGDVTADDVRRERMDRRRLHLVAASYREREPVPVRTLVGTQDDVRRGVVGVRVHRVGPVERRRRREANVAHVE
jgi:hypothetical protein